MDSGGGIGSVGAGFGGFAQVRGLDKIPADAGLVGVRRKADGQPAQCAEGTLATDAHMNQLVYQGKNLCRRSVVSVDEDQRCNIVDERESPKLSILSFRLLFRTMKLRITSTPAASAFCASFLNILIWNRIRIFAASTSSAALALMDQRPSAPSWAEKIQKFLLTCV